jgi:predicted nucleic acid-binding protein
VTRIAFDTNVLAYVAGVDRHADDAVKIDASRALLKQLRGRAALVVPVQVLGELYVVLTRSGASRDEARDAVLRMAQVFGTADSNASAFLSALDLATTHKLQFWDSLIVNAAAEAGCTLLLSEDMSDGFSWRGTVVVNPFATSLDERLTRLIA